MVRLIIPVGIKAMVSIGIAWALTTLFDSLLIFGANVLQTVLVFGFYIYCAATLLMPSGNKFFYVISIPVLTQFLHLFQKYDFPAGANSLWRLLPFLFVDLYMLSVLIRFGTGLSRVEKVVVASWVISGFVSITISPNLAGIVTGACTLILFTIPLYFAYLSVMSKHHAFPGELERALCLTFIILALGTFGLVFYGAQYKGASNLLVTRNISDTNVTMAYFILLWPFALHYAGREGRSPLLTPLLALLFALVVILSFSRGAVFIVLPYLVFSLFVAGNWQRGVWLAAVGVVTGIYSGDLIGLMNAELAYSWQLRFGDFNTTGPVLQKIQEVSGRAEIRRIAYQLFLERPLFGNGTGSFEVLGPGYREAHSLFFTVLAEQGLLGMVYLYGLFATLGLHLCKRATDYLHRLLLAALAAYLLFVHSVGSVFIIIPAKSLTINCIAPLLLICMYFYSKSMDNRPPSGAAAPGAKISGYD